VYAIGDFSEGSFGNIQEVKAFTSIAAREAFGDVRGNRVRGLTKLRTQLVSLRTKGTI
jgi:hypothetical protein